MEFALKLIIVILGFSLFIWARVIWYWVVIYKHSFLVTTYLTKDMSEQEMREINLEQFATDNLEYYQFWPILSAIIHIDKWSIKHFVVYPDRYTEVITHHLQTIGKHS